MEAQDIKAFLKALQKKVYLKEKECFYPSDCHIDLSFNTKRGAEPVPYLEYDAFKQSSKGINPQLVEKLCFFLGKTQNEHLVFEVKENLG